MKILIIGGTKFLGRSLVEIALAKGHEITLFNRGKTNPDLFPEVECLKGDRDSDLKPLQSRKWDAVVDTCGYVPRIVKKSAELLADSIEHYTYISSISAYADFRKPELDESSLLATIENETVEQVTDETYGPLKVLCEKAVEQAMPGRVLVLRPGLIVGPYDQSDRFTYWPVRVRSGGEVLAPSPSHEQIQFIDARDLAEFILIMVEKRQTDVYNCTGPDYMLTMKQFLGECDNIFGSKASFTWVSEKFIMKNGINLPLWISEEGKGIYQVNCRKAIDAGLSFRPYTDTIRDTFSWHHATRPSDYKLSAGLTTEREQELLKLWKEMK